MVAITHHTFVFRLKGRVEDETSWEVFWSLQQSACWDSKPGTSEAVNVSVFVSLYSGLELNRTHIPH